VMFHRLALPALFGIISGAAHLAAGSTAPSAYTIQTVAGSDDSGDGGSALAAALGQPEGIAVDRSGNVYVAEAANHRVRKIAPGGTIQTIAGTGVAGFAGDGGPAVSAQLNQPYGLALDSQDNLYIADLGNSRVREVSSGGTIQTVAGGGSLAATGAGQGGPATLAQLIEPRNVTVDHGGNLYISDFGANQVYRVSSAGILSLVAGTGTAGFSGDGTSALLAELNAPAGLAIDSSGALYIADSGNNRVRKVYNGVIIDVFDTPAPTGVALDSTGMLYVAAAGYFGSVVQPIAGVTSVRDLTVDSSGNIFTTSGAFVLEVSSGGALTTVAGSGGSPYFGGDGGPATSALLNGPAGIAVDSSGNWYIADTANNRIRMVTTSGEISTMAGTGTAGSSGDNGAATAAELNSPHGIAIDSAGNLYIADSGNNEVRQITPGGVISTIAGQLNNPLSVAVDGQGSVYIADSGNNQIVQVNAAGNTSTFAKLAGVLAVAVDGSGNVVAADASQVWKIASDSSGNASATSIATGLTSPGSLAFAPDGTLFVADTGANVIRELSTAGTLTAIAGNGTAGFSGDGGLALEAELSAPAGIAIGANGMLLMADSGNNRIRNLTPAAAASELVTISPLNAASLASGPIAPGEIITLFGAGFDPSNTQLLFDGKPGTLFYTSATQINALAPATLAPNTSTDMSILVDGAGLASSSIPVVAAAPGIFTTGSSGQAAAVNQDGTVNSASNPAARESIIALYATGQGTGSPAITVNIAGYNAPVLYAGPAPGFPGLMQINAQIPGGFLPPGIQAVVLSVGNVSSQAGVTIAID
jgi:trimeric autotransporter adhesin